MFQVQIQMPSEGDMVLLGQDKGTLTLDPVYYGNECMGPFVALVDPKTKKVTARYRLCFRQDGKVMLKSGATDVGS